MQVCQTSHRLGKPFSQHYTLPQLLPESYHQPVQIPASNLSKKYRLGKKNSPSPAGTFNCAAPFLHAILSASVCLVRFQKTPASGEAMCGQGFPPLTVVLILPYFLKLLDCRTPLLFRNTLFLSQLVRYLGWPATPYSPPPSRKDCMPQSNMGSLPFQGFCGMI